MTLVGPMWRLKVNYGYQVNSMKKLNGMRRVAAVVLAVWTVSVWRAAAGNEAMLKLLRLLRDKGSITAREYEELEKAAAGDEPAGKPGQPAVAPAPAILEPRVGRVEERLDKDEGDLQKLNQTVAQDEAELKKLGETVADHDSRIEKLRLKTDMTSPEVVSKALKGKWYERLSLRGYAQLRYHSILDYEGPELNVPNDRSVAETQSFLLRRGRVVLSGDVTDHLFVYAQSDLNGSPVDGADFSVQMRDYYGDISVDNQKEFRLRVGQSKVPYGWVNMQSSQNRAPLERPDALNSAVEGERDIGAFFYWAPAEIRERYRELIKKGLKGSGDYGVVGFGPYSGQGLNRSDVNGDLHFVARVAYPFKLDNGQFFELGLQGYTGRYVVGNQAITIGTNSITPSVLKNGHADQRAALSAIWYPQPFGVEAEWNIGEGPELNSAYNRVQGQFLHGGYVQLNYKIDQGHSTWFPYVRWQYYEGGRKFARNAPRMNVNEAEIGLEYSPWPEVEFSVSYTHTYQRTNTRVAPYADTSNADRLGFQVQVNY